MHIFHVININYGSNTLSYISKAKILLIGFITPQMF
jgi:hypothetical protein